MGAMKEAVIVTALAVAVVAPIAWLSETDAKRAQEFRAAGEAALARNQHEFSYGGTTYKFIHQPGDRCTHYAAASERPSVHVKRRIVHEPFIAPNCKNG